MDRNNRVDPLYRIIRMTLASADAAHCYAGGARATPAITRLLYSSKLIPMQIHSCLTTNTEISIYSQYLSLFLKSCFVFGLLLSKYLVMVGMHHLAIRKKAIEVAVAACLSDAQSQNLWMFDGGSCATSPHQTALFLWVATRACRPAFCRRFFKSTETILGTRTFRIKHIPVYFEDDVCS